VGFDPSKPSRIVEDTKPVFDPSKPTRIVEDAPKSVLSNNTVVNTDLNDAPKISYMTDTQVKNTPREKYFGQQKIDDNFIQDYVGKNSNLFQDVSRGVANEVISTGQAIKRFGTKIGARAIAQRELNIKGKTRKEVTKEMSEWENNIAVELGEIAKTNQKYRENLGIAKTEYDGVAFDLGSVFAQLGMSVVSRSPTTMASMFGITQQQQVSEEVFQNTGDAQRAEDVATLIAIPTAALEYIGLDRFLKVLKGDKLVKNVIEGFATEAIQEGSQSIVEEIGTQGFGGREKSFENTLKDIGYSMVLGGLTGGGIAGMSSVGSRRLQEKGMSPKTAEELSQSIAKRINESPDIQKQTVDILRRQNDNTTNYGNNIDNGIAEVKKAIDEKRKSLEGKTQAEVLIEEARGENINLDENTLLETLDVYEQTQKELDLIKKPKGIVQFIKENGGIFDEQGDLASSEITKQAPFVLRKSPVNNQGQDVTPDAVAQRLFDAGYFPESTERPTINELLNKINEELAGNTQISEENIEDSLRREELQKTLNSIDQEVDIDKIRKLKNLNPKERNRPALIEEALKDDGVMNEIAQKQENERIAIDVQTNIQNNILKKTTNNTRFFRKTAINVKDGSFSVKDGFDSITRPVSSMIEKISPKLWLKINKYLYTTGIEQKKSFEKIKPFNDKLAQLKKNKVQKEDYYTIDFLLKNISANKENIEVGKAYKIQLDSLLNKYDLKKDFDSVAEELNRIYGELKEVGVDVGFLQDYIPRMVDPKQKEAFLSYIEQTEQYSEIMRALKQEKFFNDMTLDERAKFVNNFLRGYIPRDVITLKRIGNIKYERNIQEIDADLNEFYLDTTDALIKYVESTTKLIEQKKLFGTERKDISTLRTAIKRKRNQIDKNPTEKAKKELKLLEEQVELMQNGSLEDSVGQIVYELASQQKLSIDEERILKRGLSGIIDFKQTSRGIQFAKNLTYALTLGNVKTSITQIGDLAFSLYNNNYMSTVQSIRNKKIDVRDLGIDSIMSELSTQDGLHKFIQVEFKYTGLTKVDLFGKNTFVNSTWISAKKKLKAGNKQINDELDFIFDEYEGQAEQVKKDILADKYTEDVGFYLYNRLSEIQPINIASMPLAYLENPNARLLYSLKTFAIKQLDFTRKEILSKIIKEPKKALANALRLQVSIMLMGGTADLIKSFWSDEDLDIEEIFLENLLIYNFLSRYTIKTATQRGVCSAVWNSITPPLIGIVDKAQQGKFLDIVPFGKDIKAIEKEL